MIVLKQNRDLPDTQAKQRILDDIKSATERFQESDDPGRVLRLQDIHIDMEIAEALRNLMLADPSHTKRDNHGSKRQKVDRNQDQMCTVALQENTIDSNAEQAESLLEEAFSVVYELDLYGLYSKDQSHLVESIFCSSQALTNLTELYLQYYHTDLSVADSMNRWLKNNKSLRKLGFDWTRNQSNQNKDSSVTHFMERMFHDVDSHAIQQLIISAGKLDAKHLVQVIQSWHVLEVLGLGPCGSFSHSLNLENLDAIVNLLCHPNSSMLKTLYISGHCVREEDVRKTLSALPHSSVERMEIAAINKPVPGYFQELVECLCHPSTKLRRLVLFWFGPIGGDNEFAPFSEDEEKAILDTLKTTNSRLEVLSTSATKKMHSILPYLVLNWAGRRFLQNLNCPMLSSLLPCVLARITRDNIEAIYEEFFQMEENESIVLCINAQYHLLREGLLVACCIQGDD